MDGDETRRSLPARLRPAAPPPTEPPPTEPPPAEPTGPAAEAATAPEAAPAPETVAQPAVAAQASAGGTAEVPPVVRRHRVSRTRALLRAVTPGFAARRVAGWTRRPSGRLALPGLLLALAIAVVGVAGAVLVPATAERTAAPAASPSATAAPSLPGLDGVPSAPPAIGGTLGPTAGGVVQRPADALKGWAAQLSSRVGVPAIALEAYGYAELVVSQTMPRCGLKWTTLAAIGKVESNHGSANNATLLADGRTVPAILGAPLDGTGGTMQIKDTDGGVLDGDRTWDRAVGPMQFIPSTWEGQAVDADNDGIRDPSDIDDAALAAANYLCRGGRNLNDVGDWWAAILTYNDVQPYARAVYQAANDYGARSRT